MHATKFIAPFDKCFCSVSECINVEQVTRGRKKGIIQFIPDLLNSVLSIVKTVNVQAANA